MLWASGNDWDREWIQQMVDLLVGHGAFTLYPALSQCDNAAERLTRWLTYQLPRVKQAHPGNLFPITGIPVAILIFDRSREKGGANENRKDVLFVDASGKDHYQAGKNQNILLDEHLDKIVAAVTAREEVEKYAHLATFDEIKENDFNLNIARCVDTFEEELEIDIVAVQAEITSLESELAEVRSKIAALLKDIVPNEAQNNTTEVA